MRIRVFISRVGPYIALLLAMEVADISRFARPKNMVSWAGLCPTVHQSGDRKYMGRMKEIDTSTLVNWAMCEAANTAVLHDPRMEAVYTAARRWHADRHAPAIVAVANKMITIAWHILKTKTPYESRNESLYRRKLARMKKRQAGSSVLLPPRQSRFAPPALAMNFVPPHSGVDQKRGRNVPVNRRGG